VKRLGMAQFVDRARDTSGSR